MEAGIYARENRSPNQTAEAQNDAAYGTSLAHRRAWNVGTSSHLFRTINRDVRVSPLANLESPTECFM